jgi:hypothetical protein
LYELLQDARKEIDSGLVGFLVIAVNVNNSYVVLLKCPFQVTHDERTTESIDRKYQWVIRKDSFPGAG